MTLTNWIGTAEAAEILGRSRSAIKYHVGTGRLVPAHRLPGATGDLLFNRGDVEALRDELADEQAC